jgi:hypothetical protein
MKMLCPAAVRDRVEEVVAIDGGYELLPTELQWHRLATKGDEAAFVSRSDDRATLVFGDALFNLAHFGGPLGVMFRLIGSTGGPRVTPLSKLIVVANRRLLASQYRVLAETKGLARLIPGHGTNVEFDAAGVLRNVADRI